MAMTRDERFPDPSSGGGSYLTPPIAPPPTPDYAGWAGSILGPGVNMSAFQAIIAQAIAGSWTVSQLQNAIIASPAFDAMFPGIKRPDGSLRMAASEYRALAEAYYNVGQDYGVNIGPTQVGMLIVGDVSPDEMVTRVQAVQKVRANPNLLTAYNEVRRADGLPPLDDQSWFSALAGEGTPDFYDHYEAAQIASAGLNVTPQAAMRVARGIGTPGQYTDLTALAQAARDMKRDIGAELLQNNISDEDLLNLEGGVDPKGIAPTLDTIIANRRAQGRYVPGSAARFGAAGGVALAPEDRPESY